MTLEILWFCVLCLLWTGYFVLEGFDFGVGMLLPVLGRDMKERAEMFETIGPVWDGNEVWLLVAGGATFAAFPAVVRNDVLRLLPRAAPDPRPPDPPRRLVRVARTNHERTLEERLDVGQHDLLIGAPLIWGIALANLLYGTPIDANGHFTGSFGDLFNWYTVLAGLAFVALFAFHGAVFLTLRTVGDLCERATRVAARIAPVALVIGAAFLIATLAVGLDRNDRNAFPGVVLVVLGGVAAIGAVVLARTRRHGLAFAATATTIVLAVVTLFTMLYPRVMVSSSNFADSLTIDNAASGHYTLTVMTVAVAILLPIVLLYQAWTYHVFRARVGHAEPIASPADLLGPKRADSSGDA